MSRIGRKAILFAIVASVCLVGAGCTNNQKELELKCADLVNEKEDMRKQNDDLQARYAKSQQDVSDLSALLARKESELAARSAQQAGTPAPAQPKAAPPEEGWEPTVAGDKISVGSDILFSSGKASLTSQGKAKLAKIARDLDGHYKGLPVKVYGFTDADPVKKSKKLWQDNLDLSANRAMAVTRYLIEKGVASDRIETIAMGQNHPVAGNSTSAGKAKNRRVEILAVKR